MQNKLNVYTTVIITVIVTCLFFCYEFPEQVRYLFYGKLINLKDIKNDTYFGREDPFFAIPSTSFTLKPVINLSVSAYTKSQNAVTNKPDNSIAVNTTCPDVLKYMTYGQWETRNVSQEEKKEMDIFLLKARNQYGIPESLQRQDGKCGNNRFENPKLSWFRPLCDPKGPTPCCYNDVCADMSVKECVCENCYDMRTVINTEHANWVPSNRQCPIPSRTGNQLCQFVDGLTIYFLGDSFVRHIYLAFILLLKDNLIDGAMRSFTSKEQHDACAGYYMFTEKQCRPILIVSPDVCKSRVKLHFSEYASSKMGYQIQNVMLRSNDPKTYFIVGTGVHDDFNTNKIWNSILLPVLQKWRLLSLEPSRLLWHAAHAPGLLKTPFVPTQGYDRAIEFNKEMKVLLQQYNVPIFESFNFTDGVNSFDGAHFGQGVNLLKARIIFEYFRELKEKGKF